MGLPLAGCAELPASAPTAGEIELSSNTASTGIYVLDLNERVMQALAMTPEPGFSGRFTNKAPAADLRIAVGDSLQISVIEESGSLFHRPNDAANGANGVGGLSQATLLPVTVERNGMVTVPYAGKIKAAGLTFGELSAEIEHKLADQSVNPQVQVAPAAGAGAGGAAPVGANSAAVGGEVNKSGVIELRASGSRLLDVIAEAGGAKFPAYETTVQLTRGKKEASVPLDRIVKNADENIFVYPGDSVYVSHEPKMYSVLGASTKVGRYTFGSKTVNLAEAVAEAGGFVDNAADPSGVFLFRYESPAVVKNLKPGEAVPMTGPIPVIYRLNLRDGDGFFRARQFQVRDKDIILLANADGAQLLKFVNLLEGITGIGANIHTIATPVKNSNGSSSTNITQTVVQ